jgi:hypothetical protein
MVEFTKKLLIKQAAQKSNYILFLCNKHGHFTSFLCFKFLLYIHMTVIPKFLMPHCYKISL